MVLAPDNAFERVRGCTQITTLDGKVCLVEFFASWSNDEGQAERALDATSLAYFGVPFSRIRSVWVNRLGQVGNYWHLIKLKEL